MYKMIENQSENKANKGSQIPRIFLLVLIISGNRKEAVKELIAQILMGKSSTHAD